jgi:hypothetical protein
MSTYDRRISPRLLALLQPGGSLAFLVDIVRLNAQTRLEFRPGDTVHLYLGRTSLLETRLRTSGDVEFSSHAEYACLTEELFGVHSVECVPGLSQRVRDHVVACQHRASPSFTDGEAVVQTGLMRRYSLNHTTGDPILALDSEIRLAFASVAARNAHEMRAREILEVGLAPMPRKLDVLGVLPTGDLSLVEVKKDQGDLAKAALQLAAHALLFAAVSQQPTLSAVLTAMIKEKILCGLLPPGAFSQVKENSKFVLTIAAPDRRGDWLSHWKRQLDPVLGRHPNLLNELRLWRLSHDGRIEEERRP